jgi:hypothetical protein
MRLLSLKVKRNLYCESLTALQQNKYLELKIVETEVNIKKIEVLIVQK